MALLGPRMMSDLSAQSGPNRTLIRFAVAPRKADRGLGRARFRIEASAAKDFRVSYWRRPRVYQAAKKTGCYRLFILR